MDAGWAKLACSDALRQEFQVQGFDVDMARILLDLGFKDASHYSHVRAEDLEGKGLKPLSQRQMFQRVQEAAARCSTAASNAAVAAAAPAQPARHSSEVSTPGQSDPPLAATNSPIATPATPFMSSAAQPIVQEILHSAPSAPPPPALMRTHSTKSTYSLLTDTMLTDPMLSSGQFYCQQHQHAPAAGGQLSRSNSMACAYPPQPAPMGTYPPSVPYIAPSVPSAPAGTYSYPTYPAHMHARYYPYPAAPQYPAGPAPYQAAPMPHAPPYAGYPWSNPYAPPNPYTAPGYAAHQQPYPYPYPQQGFTAAGPSTDAMPTPVAAAAAACCSSMRATVEDMKRQAKQLYTEAVEERPDVEGSFRKFFGALDRDGDGKVTLEEFRFAVDAKIQKLRREGLMNEPRKKEMMETAEIYWKLVDMDGDGQLDEDEVLTLFLLHKACSPLICNNCKKVIFDEHLWLDTSCMKDFCSATPKNRMEMLPSKAAICNACHAKHAVHPVPGATLQQVCNEWQKPMLEEWTLSMEDGGLNGSGATRGIGGCGLGAGGLGAGGTAGGGGMGGSGSMGSGSQRPPDHMKKVQAFVGLLVNLVSITVMIIGMVAGGDCGGGGGDCTIM